VVFRELGIALFIIALALVAWIKQPNFLSAGNARSVALAIPLWVVVAMGQMIVIISRNIDLSVGSIMGLAAVVSCGCFVGNPQFPIWAATIVAIGVGAIAGLGNGVLTSLLRVPSIVVTLGTLSAYRGLTFMWSGGKQVPRDALPESLIKLSQTSPILGIPWIILLAGAVAVITALYLRFTRTGREIFAMGSNPAAAVLRGIPVRKNLLLIFAFSGALSGLAGMMYASKLGYVNPRDTGSGFELIVISAAVIGGTNVFGGSGTVLGTVLGCLLIGKIRTALPMMDVSAFWESAVYGLAILLACVVDTLIQRRARSG
jgi:rhamnose transport system permease protein